STHYHCVVLRSWLGARENARHYGIELPAGYDEHLARAVEFAMHCHRPDGTIPELSDADGGSYLDLLALAADLLGREDFRHVATRGVAGTAPAVRNASFPDGGYFVQRSGWDAGARFLMFDCGPLAPEALGAVEVDGSTVRAPGLALVFHGGASPVVEDGWFSPEYGVKLPAPVVSVAVEAATDALFTTLVVPLEDGRDAPELRVQRFCHTTVVRAGTDMVAWSDGPRPAAWLTREAAGA